MGKVMLNQTPASGREVDSKKRLHHFTSDEGDLNSESAHWPGEGATRSLSHRQEGT